MKFTSTKENMLSGISTVQKAISNKGAIPVLTGIYLKTEIGKSIIRIRQ